MDDATDRIQDHPLDESTGVHPQHFDDEGYVVGHPHHTTVSSDQLTPEGTLVDEEQDAGGPPRPA